MISIETLITPVTRDEAKQSIYDVLATVGVDTTSWKPGAVVRTIIAAVAILFAACTNLIADIARAGFLDLTSGSWLTLVAQYVYGVTRIEATFGTGTLRLVNTGGGVFDYDPGEFVARNPDTDKTYTNVETFHLGSGETLSIAIIAQEAGSASTSVIGTIVELVTVLSNVTCSNTSAVVGADEETDEALKIRCREQLGARSANGPSDAYAAIARAAKRSDGTPIGASRIRIVKDGKGNAYLYLATTSGGVPGDAETLDTDLGDINDQIQRYVAPLGFTAHTRSANAYALNVSYRVWMLDSSGLTNAQVEDLINARLAAFLSQIPIGGYVLDDGSAGKIFLDGLSGEIKATRPEIFHVDFVSPTADLTLAAFDAPTPGTIAAAAIYQVQQKTI